MYKETGILINFNEEIDENKLLKFYKKNYKKKYNLIKLYFKNKNKNNKNMSNIEKSQYFEIYKKTCFYYFYNKQKRYIAKKNFSIIGPLAHILPEMTIRNIFHFLYGH